MADLIASPCRPIAVSAKHVHEELVLLDLRLGLIVSDHPAGMGRAGQCPNPGQLLRGGLAPRRPSPRVEWR
jgi:hypothetical protein